MHIFVSTYIRNETELRQFFAERTCLQLSPPAKKAEWTIFAEIPLKRQQVSLVTDDGVLLIGGHNNYSVNLVKKDGTVEHVWDLKRYIELKNIYNRNRKNNSALL